MLIDGDLADAMEGAVLTRLERARLGEGPWITYVIDATDRLVLVLVVSELIRFDGFSVMQADDLTSIEVSAPNRDFVEEALRLRGEHVEAAPEVDLASFASVLNSTREQFPLVAIYKEERDPDVCFVGSVVDVSQDSVSLLEISPSAEWDESPTTHRLSEITRVDFGGDYVDALYLVGGPPPNPPVRIGPASRGG